MKVEDFIKDIALNMDSNNWKTYKQAAAAMTVDPSTMTGDELADIINNGISYDDALNKVFQGDIKKFNTAVKKLMTDTEYPMYFVKDVYMKNKKSFKWFNLKTKDKLATPQLIGVENMTEEVVKYWLDDTTNQMYKEGNMTNDFRLVVASDDKKLITQVVNHKNFKNVASHYAIRDLLAKKANHLTKGTFDKALTRHMQLINQSRGWNTNFAKELAFLGGSPYLQVKHFGMFTDVQAEAIIEYAKQNGHNIPAEVLEYMYARTGDESFLPQAAKDMFLF